MNAHTPFDANQDWSNPYCRNSSNDPMVDALLGNAYHVVRTVYCNLGYIKHLYDFLSKYGVVICVQSEAELKTLTTEAKYARIYDKSPAGDLRVTDYLYVEDDRTGVLPDDTTATGSWVKVATSNSGVDSKDGGYIPWVYNSGSATGGETSIRIPDETAGAPFMIVNGEWQTEGYDFEYDPLTFEIKFTTPLEQGDFVVVMRTGVPAAPDNPNVSDWVTINWLYNHGAAVGGEQVIDIPYTFQSVPAVYKNGLRFYRGLANNSYTIDSDNNRIILTEPLATNDRLVIQLGGEAKILETVDHTIQEVARAANVKDSEVILSTDTTQVLNGKRVIYDVVSQRIYGLPSLPTNIYINAVSDGQLTYSPGNITVTLLDSYQQQNTRELWRRSLAEAGLTLVDGSFEEGATVNSKTDAVWYIAVGQCYTWDGAFPKVVASGSTPATAGGVGAGKWVSVAGAGIRSDLGQTSGAERIGTATSQTLAESLYAEDSPMSFGQATAKAKSRLATHGCRVLLVGDSLSSFYNIDTANITSLFESYLRRKVHETNPSAEFINRAIGGMRYYDLGRDEPPANLGDGYPWFTDSSRRWMSYIEEAKPDVIFIAFGMNDGPGWDGGNFQQPVFYKMVEELRSISSDPELVFCTNILPSTVNPATATEEQQSGRDAIAGWTRSYAKFAGYSFIDFHRRFKSLRDGVDPCVFSFRRSTISTLVDLPYTYTSKVPCYSVRLTVVDPAVLVTGIQMNLSSLFNNFVSLSYNSALGKWQLQHYTGTSLGVTLNVFGDGPAPVPDQEIHMSLNGDVLTVFIGDNTKPIFSGNIIRFGGKFTPRIGGTGQVRVDIMAGLEVPVAASLTDADIYSTGVDGGNGLNHPTAKSSSRIYPPPLDYWFNSAGPEPIKFDIVADFRSGKLEVSNKLSPKSGGVYNLFSKLTFINGSAEYVRDSENVVIGACFGSTNRAYIDTADYMEPGLSFKRLTVEIEMYAPSGAAHVLSLGEAATGDRSMYQVTTGLQLRATTSSSGQSTDLTSSASYPMVAGRDYTLIHNVDLKTKVAALRTVDGFKIGNTNTHAITSLLSALLSKIKFGYASPSTFGGDVIIKRVRISFR